MQGDSFEQPSFSEDAFFKEMEERLSSLRTNDEKILYLRELETKSVSQNALNVVISRAAEIFENDENYYWAADYYEKVADFEKAAQMCEKDNRLYSAAELWEKAGEIEKANNLREKLRLQEEKEWVAEIAGLDIITEIHKYNPKYVFLTETSSVAFGYVIKEALKNAYPDAPLPKFYRIDPRQVREVMIIGQKIAKGEIDLNTSEFQSKKKELEDFFLKRITDKEAKILIYDRDWADGKSPGSILALLKNPENFGFSKEIKVSNIKMNLNEQGSTETRPEGFPELELDIKESDILPIHGYGMYPYKRVTRKNKNGKGENYNFRGTILSGQSNDIKEYKRRGAMLGKDLLSKRQKIKPTTDSTE